MLEKSIFIKPIKTMINHSSTEIFIDNLEVDADCLVDEEKGFQYILDGMNAERILIASECIGDAKYFIDKGKNICKPEDCFGSPISKSQSIQFPVQEHSTRAAELMVQKACLFDNPDVRV